MPKGTDVHVGFFWLQSKQTCQEDPVSLGAFGRLRHLTYLICWLLLELVKDLDRLLLCRKSRHDAGLS